MMAHSKDKQRQQRQQQLFVVVLAIIALTATRSHAWSIHNSARTGGGTVDVSRRDWMTTASTWSAAALVATTATATTSAILVAAPEPAVAIAAAQSSASTSLQTELEQRLPLGHARVRYLLDHWDDVTSICGTTIMSDVERAQIIRTEGGNTCTKTPLRVQEFMGYKSITDPLYRVDKLLVKVTTENNNNMVDPDNIEDYLDAVERYRETADATAQLAYISSWGEANPNGSKEAIDEYLAQTKAQVIESEKLLRAILGYLQLQPLPPLTGKL